MKEIKRTCYKGTRIILGNTKRMYLNKCIDILMKHNFEEIQIPIIQLQDHFKNKVGVENNNLMFNFTDRGGRDICLAPEYTSIIQQLATSTFKYQKDVKVFYVAECFRGENPQLGRYRQFTQLGVEIINPSNKEIAMDLCYNYAENLVSAFDVKNWTVNKSAKRGLDYYKNGKGFEIICDELGSSKQICGGGEYDGGVGFAIGVDRILTLINKNK